MTSGDACIALMTLSVVVGPLVKDVAVVEGCDSEDAVISVDADVD